MKWFKGIQWSDCVFDWHDLDGKQLDIIITSNDEGYVVWGNDKRNEKIYILHMETTLKS